MIKKYIGIYCLFFCVNLLFAQEKEKSFDVKPGSYALEFSIRPNLRLSSFEGSSVSMKKCIDNFTFYRLGVTINSFLYNNDVTNLTKSFDTIKTLKREDKDPEKFSLQLNFDRIQYISNEGFLKSYYGIGGFLGYDYWKGVEYLQYPIDYEKDINGPIAIRHPDPNTKTTINGIFTGLRASLGCECFITKAISINVEYLSTLSFRYAKMYIKEDIYEWIGGVYLKGKRKEAKVNSTNYYRYMGTTEADGYSREWRFDNTILFGLSVYF